MDNAWDMHVCMKTKNGRSCTLAYNIAMDAFIIIMGKPKPPPLLCMSAKSTRLESHAIKIYTHPPQPALGDHLQVAGRILG